MRFDPPFRLGDRAVRTMIRNGPQLLFADGSHGHVSAKWVTATKSFKAVVSIHEVGVPCGQGGQVFSLSLSRLAELSIDLEDVRMLETVEPAELEGIPNEPPLGAAIGMNDVGLDTPP